MFSKIDRMSRSAVHHHMYECMLELPFKVKVNLIVKYSFVFISTSVLLRSRCHSHPHLIAIAKVIIWQLVTRLTRSVQTFFFPSVGGSPSLLEANPI